MWKVQPVSVHNPGMRSAVLAVLLLIPGLAAARPPARPHPAPSPASACQAAIAAEEQAEHLPPGLLPAMALVESGRPDPVTGAAAPWPWTIDVGGAGQFFPTEQDAVNAVAALQAAGLRSIDVGCLQVNLSYHPDAFVTLEEAFDPVANVRYAARFLTALYRQTGNWPAAAAAYHSQTPELAADYRRRVLAIWSPQGGPAAPAPVGNFAAFAPAQASFAAFRPQSEQFAAFAPGG